MANFFFFQVLMSGRKRSDTWKLFMSGTLQYNKHPFHHILKILFIFIFRERRREKEGEKH